MAEEIRIKKKKGEDGHKIITVRMPDSLVQRLDLLSEQTNRSRNEIINTLLEKALDIVTIEE